jgi:2-keto-4-pentenoate hydratase/2-oxohepta-3-ene-1,7-dioic acid hydratase in catechol pathway
MNYRHRFVDGEAIRLPVGKVVCVGRNYLEHIHELHNPIPDAPILFMKPSTALVGLQEPLVLPADRGSCQHEVELAVLLGQTLCQADGAAVRRAVVGYAIALDLTLRDLQSELKAKGHPWERAKAFDGACPISPFLRPAQLPDPQDTPVSLQVNGVDRQRGNTRQMLWGIVDLVAHISHCFTLLPGDVVLTGTPAGVGELRSGDKLRLALGEQQSFDADVA